MTSNLKCPFCLQELKKNESGAYYCTTKWCDLWGVIISRCAAEHFTQTTQDMLNAAKMLATKEKDLEITTKALKNMMESGGDGYHIARKALEQIEHKE